MSGYVELLVNPQPLTFAGLPRDYRAAKAVLVGVPYDAGSTCKPGCRFAPRRLREVSQNLETYDPLLGVEVSELPAADAGDVGEVLAPAVMVDRVSRVVGELASLGKIPLLVGGDHTVTLGALSGLRGRVSLVMFDAHLDYRDEFPQGERVSHATVLRRAREGLVEEAVVIGARAVSKEEVEALKRDSGVRVVYQWDLSRAADELSTLSGDVYITLDVDVLDPSIAPGVGCPEPGGLTYGQLVELLSEAASGGVVGVDVVEVNPLVDVNDVTSCVAAKLLMKVLALLLAR